MEPRDNSQIPQACCANETVARDGTSFGCPTAHSFRINPMSQEIGITGGEEDGVNNEDVDNNSLYTQPEDILAIYKALSPISPYFSIAAGFGNVHGVYKPGNVKLHPELLGKHQKYVKDAIGAKEDKPVFLVFHGGSGSSKQ